MTPQIESNAKSKIMEKLLSIIVPSYNMEKYLPNGLASLVVGDAELLQSLDVIVVNDGSKDRTSEIAHGFEAKHPGVFRVLDKSNGNYGSCVNAALPLAAGRFVKILDADDSYDTAAFERYLRALAALPATTDVVFNDYISVDEEGRVTETTTYSFPTDAAFGVADILSRDCFIAMHAVAYRTALLREIGYHQTEGISYTDTEWTYLPVAFAREIRYVPEKVYRYLLGRDGQTMEPKTIVRNLWMQDKILDKMLKQYDEVSCSREARAYLEYQLKRMFAEIFNRRAMTACGQQLDDYLKDVRQKMSAYAFLSDRMRSLAIFARMPFRFHYADFVLRHPRFARPTLLLVKLYSWLRAKL